MDQFCSSGATKRFSFVVFDDLGGGLGASRLEIDPDLKSLLPGDHEVILSMERIERSLGTTGAVNIVVKGGDSKARRAFAEEIARSFEKHSMLRDIDYRLSSDFFAEHALYYLSDAEMEDLKEKVSAWQHYEFCTSAPDVCVDKPDPKASQDLRDFLESKRDEARTRTGFDDYYESDELSVLALFLHPSEPSDNLDFDRALTKEVRGKLAKIYEQDGPWSGTDLSYNAIGTYIVKADEQATIQRDMVKAGVVGLLGVVLVIYLLFRSWRGVLVLLVPLITGVVWSLAATELILGHLNSMTSLISSVVMGMGIDAGIHFFSRVRRERKLADDQEAIRRAFCSLIIPLLVASSTTVGAFVVMATSGFPAFREFGIIAALGVLLCLLAMVTVFPALLATVGVKPPRRKVNKNEAAPDESMVAPVGAEQVRLITRVLLAKPGLVFAGVVGLTLFSFEGFDRVRKDGFERNGRTLQSDQTRDLVEADAALLSKLFKRNVHAGIYSVDSLDDLHATNERASERLQQRQKLGESTVAELFSVAQLLPDPSLDLKKRRRAIEELTEDFSERTWARLEGRDPDEATTNNKQAKQGGGDSEDWEDADGEEFDEFDDFAAADDPSGSETGEAKAKSSSAAQVEQKGDKNEGKSEEAESPKTDQKTKGDGSEEIKESALTPEQARLMRKMVDAKPFGSKDLPESVLSKIRGSDGKWMVYAYPNFDVADILTSVRFMEETRQYGLGPKNDAVYVGESTVFAAMYLMMKDEWPRILGMAACLIAGLVFWQVRSVRQTMMTLVPLGIGLWWMLGILGYADIKFTLFNVPILPALLGIGVDNGVYLATGIREGEASAQGLGRSVQETGGAILAATTTTAVGFASFFVADSGGLRGIGHVAVLGILVLALAAVLILPTVAALSRKYRD